MSAITITAKELGPDGIRRYRTSWKVIIKSHQYSSTVNLSSSLLSFQSSKNIKSVGTASMTLTGARNILNLVYPNDYINVYCDRADGQGWTRVFFGFVDHVEEISRVDTSSGKPTTNYTLQCSDFQKAFDRTELYFNPHVAARNDFSGGFVGTPNIGGAALRTRGLRVSGGPSDLVVNTVLLLLGFGTQFTLPTSYSPRTLDRIRKQRADFILNKLTDDVRNQIMNLGGYSAFLYELRSRLGASNLVGVDDVLTTADGEVIDLSSPFPSMADRADEARFSQTAIRNLSPGSAIGVEGESLIGTTGGEAFNILNTTVAGYPPTLLDIIDIFTFVERGAIDGYNSQTSMWDKQGSVASFMRSVSNEIVNELFFDLRPVSRDGGLTAGTDFSRDSDDIGGNDAHGDGGANGIMYQPAIIMREYPFSTIEGIDASNVPISLSARGSAEVFTLGKLTFGAIFSNEPNIPGRHIVNIPSINTEDLALGVASTVAKKHLDVAVVYDPEIVSTRLSRSDTDHFNLFELISESALLGESTKFMMMDLLPIITPTHISRHGLRKRSLNTRFARFSLATVNRTNPPPPPPPPPPPEDTPAPDAVLPAPSTTATVLPVELVETTPGLYTIGYVGTGNQWWYRPWNTRTPNTRPVNNVKGNPIPPGGTPYWRFHNGVDVRGPSGTPVRAVRDGLVVMACPVGVRGRDGYGNIVMIYHPQDEMYSLYAHLQSIAPALTVASRSRRLSAFSSSRLIGGGRYVEIPVTAGQTIGLLGDSDAPGQPHLHFEFNIYRPGKRFSSGTDRKTVIPDFFRNAATALRAPRRRAVGYAISASRPPNPSESLTISQDPIRVFRERFGLRLPVGGPLGASVLPILDIIPPGEIPPEGVADTDGAEEAITPDLRTPEPEPVTSTAAARSEERRSGHVDTPSGRRILSRWALLNDHWYQHNLEYLSGSIEMRGAPEIRIGYRLDLPDRAMSFYTEGVSHTWSVEAAMSTTLHVTRGQPTSPHPVYVAPFLTGFSSTESQRQHGSRLSSYFIVPDPLSVARSISIYGRSRHSSGEVGAPADRAAYANGMINTVDQPNDSGSVGDRYNETVIEAATGDVDPYLRDFLREAEEVMLGLGGAGSGLSSGSVANPGASTDMSDFLADVDDVFSGRAT